jgi:hypothetical protein
MITPKKELGNIKGGLSPNLVIVRGFAGEPVPMEAVRIGPRSVTVRRPGGNDMTVRFSYEDVYCFVQEQYAKLVKAFTSDDRETLDRLWRESTPIR